MDVKLCSFILLMVLHTILACKAPREKTGANSSALTVATDENADKALPPASMPEFKLTNSGTSSGADVNTLEFAYDAKDAKYIEYRICDDKGICLPEGPSGVIVPAGMNAVSATVENGGFLKLMARACNYSGSYRNE